VRRPRRGAALARLGPVPALALGLLLVACAPTIFTDVEYSTGQRRAPREDSAPVAPGDDKARVMELLGPPGEVLPSVRGDIFSYRLRYIDLELVQLNAGLVGPAPLPLWARATGTHSDDAVMIFFDEQGVVRNLAAQEAENRQPDLRRTGR
jgi:hypothetical protein